MTAERFMRRAIALSEDAVAADQGGPFGAVIVKDGAIIAEGQNQVTSVNDPTAHAEVNAIREACAKLATFDLAGAEIYTSCEPCPMCLAAIYWARLDRIVFANAREDAAAIGFDDAFLYEELATAAADRKVPVQRLLSDEAKAAFRAWDAKTDKIRY